MSTKRRKDDVEDPAVIAHRERARRAIETRPTTVIVAATIQEAQGVAFTLAERHVAIVSARRATIESGLDRPGLAIVHVHPSARKTRYASELDEVLAGLRARGVEILEARA